jgi:hypothetical protein
MTPRTAAKRKPKAKPEAPVIPVSLRKACTECLRVPCECNQGRGVATIGELPNGIDLGEPFHPIVIYLITAAICLAGGIGIGYAVWA